MKQEFIKKLDKETLLKVYEWLREPATNKFDVRQYISDAIDNGIAEKLSDLNTVKDAFYYGYETGREDTLQMDNTSYERWQKWKMENDK